MEYPLWATPERRQSLVELFLKCRGGCVFSEQPCQYLEHHVYEIVIEGWIEEWKSSDREARSLAWKQEKRRMHRAPLKHLKQGQFDSITRENYLANRPTFRIVAIGINAFTQQRVVKVEIPDLFKKVIWVNVQGVNLSKNKLRKLFRNPKGELPEELYQIVSQRIRGYLQ